MKIKKNQICWSQELKIEQKGYEAFPFTNLTS